MLNFALVRYGITRIKMWDGKKIKPPTKTAIIRDKIISVIDYMFLRIIFSNKLTGSLFERYWERKIQRKTRALLDSFAPRIEHQEPKDSPS